MATNENLIPIPGRLHSVATEGHVAGADEIFDDTLNKDQATLNADSAYLGDDDGQAVIPGFDPQTDTLHKAAQVLTTAEKDQVAQNLNNRPSTNGMARIELKATDNFKSVVEAQTGGNTVFVIKYDFTLTGNVTIPANCVLEFDGGSISGGNINLNKCYIKDTISYIFNNVTFNGQGFTNFIRPEWFDSQTNILSDATTALQKAIDNAPYFIVGAFGNDAIFPSSAVLKLEKPVYNTTAKILVNTKINIEGNGSTIKAIGNQQTVIEFNRPYSNNGYKGYVNNLNIDGSKKNIKGILVDGTCLIDFYNINIINCFNYNFHLKSGYECMLNDIKLLTKGVEQYPSDLTDFKGLVIDHGDMYINNFTAYNIPIPIVVNSGANFISNVHIWGDYNGILPRTAIVLNSEHNFVNNVYCDTVNIQNVNQPSDYIFNGIYNGGCALMVMGSYNTIKHVIINSNQDVIESLGETPSTTWLAFFASYTQGCTIYDSHIMDNALPDTNPCQGSVEKNVILDVKSSLMDANASKYSFLPIYDENLKSSTIKKVPLISSNLNDDSSPELLIIAKDGTVKRLDGSGEYIPRNGTLDDLPSPGNQCKYGVYSFYSWDLKRNFQKISQSSYLITEGIEYYYGNTTSAKDAAKFTHKGTTAQRPTNLGWITVPIGFYYFDTDLNIPIWYNGKENNVDIWVDATGTQK